MSEENVEVVRRGTDLFNRRDIDELLEVWDSEGELDWSRSAGVEAGVYHGHQAVRDVRNRFQEMWERVIVSPDEFIECGESVVVPGRAYAAGRDGIEVEAYGVFVYTVRDGRIVRLEVYDDRSEALKAAGL